MSAEVAHLGITVNAINPYPTDTGWMTEEVKQGLKPMFPFGRIGEPKDAARLIKFLISEEAEWITGQVIHSEGGFKDKKKVSHQGEIPSLIFLQPSCNTVP